MSNQVKQRLFFALWPAKKVVCEINDNVLPFFASCHGRITASSNWHITLAFFGNADSQTRECLEAKAGTIQQQSFKLLLSQTGYWKKPKVAWLAPAKVPTELISLVTALQDAIEPCGFIPENRKYKPHVTLVRKANTEPVSKQVDEIMWKCDSFCLVESVSTPHGVRYNILREWSFK